MKTLEKLCKKFLTIHSRTVKILLTVLLLGLTTTVHANEFRHWNEWTNKEKVSFAAYNALTYIDYSQTKRALSHPCGCYVESNPIFGKDPHPDKLAIANVLASAYLYRYLGKQDPDGGLPALWIVSGMRVGVIIHNDQVGISWKAAF